MKLFDSNRKLQNFLINRRVQLKIVWAHFLYMVAVILVTISVTASPFVYDYFLTTDPITIMRAKTIISVLSERLFYTIGVLSIFGFCHMILLSHQFCGPLVNINRTLTKLADGDFTRKVFLRKHDLLDVEAYNINTFIDEMTTHIDGIKTENRLLSSSLEEIAKLKGDPEKLEEAIQNAREHASLLQEKLQSLKIIPDDLKKDAFEPEMVTEEKEA